MNVTATEAEINETHELIGLLRNWEKLRGITGQYNRGRVILEVDGTVGKVRLPYIVDVSDGLRPDANSVAKCNRAIRVHLASELNKITATVCEIIKKHMPIPVE